MGSDGASFQERRPIFFPLRMDTVRQVLLLLLLLLGRCCWAVDLQAALKMAQCRAHCLDKFEGNLSKQDDASCHQNSDCFGCWENCELLATNFPIWSITCGQRDICGPGCESACAFHSEHPKGVVPLSEHNSRLTLVFGGSAAHWTLTWGLDAPEEHVVFALFTRTPGGSWDLRLQTAAFGAALGGLPGGSIMKLVAVAESGVLSVIITPYAPPSRPKGAAKPAVGLSSRPGAASSSSASNGIGAEAEMWPLLHEAEAEGSGLVAARVWWAPQSARGGDYLVTWEVEGGGLKGHLYTDLPEVDLTLWPETVYHVRVELVSGPLGEAVRSAQLTLDTRNITLAAHARQNEITPTLPLVRRAAAPAPLEVVLGVGGGVLAALLAVAALVWRRRRAAGHAHDAASAPSAKWGAWRRTLSDLTLDESLVVKSLKTPESNQGFCAAPARPHARTPVFTLAAPPSAKPPGPARPNHANLYSVVPPDPRNQISNI